MSNTTDLNPLLHSPLRLKIISYLVANGDTDFKTLQNVTGATPGNISVQLKKLQQAGYITITKTFKDNYQHTKIHLTEQGLQAFEQYVEALKQYIFVKPKNQ